MSNNQRNPQDTTSWHKDSIIKNKGIAHSVKDVWKRNLHWESRAVPHLIKTALIRSAALLLGIRVYTTTQLLQKRARKGAGERCGM